MFAFATKEPDSDTLVGQLVYLARPARQDHQEWAKLRAESYDFLQPWEPTWHPTDLSRAAFRQRLRRYDYDRRIGYALTFFIKRQNDHALLGGITIGHIKRGVALSGQVGYWIGHRYARQGFTSEALQLTCQHAFTRCGLHRLEAACIPDNVASVRLLEKCGFIHEGHLAAYLKINGKWRDHALYARINPNDAFA